MRTITISCCMALLAGVAHSQTADESDLAPLEPAAEARQYAVELIIFAYNEDDSVGTEAFLPDVIDEDDGVPVFSDRVDPVDDPIDESPPPEVVQLPEDEFSLDESYGRLSRLQAYRPLMHFGWIQPTAADDEPVLIELEQFGVPPEGLAGTVSLTLSRYLHLAIDLSLAAADSNTTTPADWPAGFGDERALSYAPLRYTLAENRIMKPGDTRYFDHPKFGVIAKVTRYGED